MGQEVTKKIKNNWILVVGGLGLFLTLILYLIFGLNEAYLGSRNYSDLPLTIALLSSSLIAPVLEEFIFRGFFCDKKIFNTIAIIGLSVFFLLNISNVLIYLPYLLFILIYFNYKDKLSFGYNFVIIINAIMFSLFHYKLNDLMNFSTFYQPLAQFSVGMITIWIVINYNIYKSILFHFCWNVFFTLIFLISIQFPNKKENIFSNDTAKVVWSRISRVNECNASTLEFFKHKLVATNIEAREFYELLDIENPNKKIGGKVLQVEPYMKYNFVIIFKDSLNQSDIRINSQKLLEDLDFVIKSD